VRYYIAEFDGCIIVHVSGEAENNEPLLAKHLLSPWLRRTGEPRVIINFIGLREPGVWEIGLLASLKKEVDLCRGVLRICHFDSAPDGFFRKNRFAEYFNIYEDLKSAMAEKEANRWTTKNA
jgi:hypothetical protein